MSPFIEYVSRRDQLGDAQDGSLRSRFYEQCEMVCYICAVALSVRECSDISDAVSRTSVMGKVSIRPRLCSSEQKALFIQLWTGGER